MKKFKAFTLVELLVVVVIIGILATLVVVGLSSASNKAKDAKTKTSIEAVNTAIQIAIADGTDDLNSVIKSACGNGIAADVSGACQTTISTNFSSAPIDGTKAPIRIQVTGATTYKLSGKSATDSTKCYLITESDNSGLNTTADAANCL